MRRQLSLLPAVGAGMTRTRGIFTGSVIDGLLSALAEHLLELPEGLGLDIIPFGLLGSH